MSEITQKQVDAVLGPEWSALLWPEFNKPYMRKITHYIAQCRQQGIPIAPPKGKVYEAYKKTPYDKVRVVIIGQDPYPIPGMASGLAFGIARNCLQVSGSLRNINKELENDLGFQGFLDLTLEDWASQGVLLLNSALTTVVKQIGAHDSIGWHHFIDRTIEELAKIEHTAWIVWGYKAQVIVSDHVDPFKHFIIYSAHPSPKSAERGFFGSKPFSRVNEYFRKRGEPEINWWKHEEKPKLANL